MKNSNVYVAIIGGGAAGLMCACVAKKRHPDKRIVIIERDNRVGKKILVSGNSRCNLTNLNSSLDNYNGSFKTGVIFLLKNYSPAKIIEYFESIGLMCKPDSDNRVYPLSRQASAVLSVLRNELKRLGVEEICDTEVTSVSKEKDGYKLTCNEKNIYAQKVVIATGGKNNYAQKIVTNTYSAAQSLGHKITSLSPSLSVIKVDCPIIKSLKGIRAQGKVTAVVNGKNVKCESGEIQFGADCLSGICVFNLSGIINCEKEARIIVQLLPDYSYTEIKDMLHIRKALTGNDNVQEIFTGLFHKNIGIALLKESKIDTAICADKLTNTQLSTLASTINEWKFKTKQNTDFSAAQVTRGGICGNEIDPHTLESKKAKNVYLCGETIDVDGDCGGYNLQFAFSSGMCVGEQL